MVYIDHCLRLLSQPKKGKKCVVVSNKYKTFNYNMDLLNESVEI